MGPPVTSAPPVTPVCSDTMFAQAVPYPKYAPPCDPVPTVKLSGHADLSSANREDDAATRATERTKVLIVFMTISNTYLFLDIASLGINLDI